MQSNVGGKLHLAKKKEREQADWTHLVNPYKEIKTQLFFLCLYFILVKTEKKPTQTSE